MKKKFVNSTIHRLSTARAALRDHEKAPTLRDKKEAWFRFLTAHAGVFEKLRAAAKEAGGNAAAWYGRITKERKDDPLLSYLHHARDVDYHGLEEVTQQNPGRMSFEINGMPIITFFAAEEVEEETPLASLTDSSGATFRNEFEDTHLGLRSYAPRLRAVTVVDERYGDRFEPPSSHDGQPIDSDDPLVLGQLGLRYAEAMVEVAKALTSD